MAISSISGLYNNAINAFSSQKSKDNSATLNTEKSASISNNSPELKTQNIFDRFLSQTNSDSQTTTKQDFDTLNARLDALRSQGKTLLHHPLPNEIRDYLRDVKSFLGDLRDNAYSAKYKDQLFQRMDITDKKLDKLADDFLQGQKPELDLIHSLGELQGILVDVFA